VNGSSFFPPGVDIADSHGFAPPRPGAEKLLESLPHATKQNLYAAQLQSLAGAGTELRITCLYEDFPDWPREAPWIAARIWEIAGEENAEQDVCSDYDTRSWMLPDINHAAMISVGHGPWDYSLMDTMEHASADSIETALTLLPPVIEQLSREPLPLPRLRSLQ